MQEAFFYLKGQLLQDACLSADNKELFHCTVHFQVGSGEGQEELSGAKMASVMLPAIQTQKAIKSVLYTGHRGCLLAF